MFIGTCTLHINQVVCIAMVQLYVSTYIPNVAFLFTFIMCVLWLLP